MDEGRSKLIYTGLHIIYNAKDSDCIPFLERTKDLFLKEKNSKDKPIVVIDASYEGESNFKTESFLGGWADNKVNYWDKLHSLLSEYDSEKIILLRNDPNISEKYTKWLEIHNVKRVFGRCIYRPETLLNRSIDFYEKNPKKQNNPKAFKSKHFICMNGAAKSHRFDMVELLFANGWDRQGHISYLNKYKSEAYRKYLDSKSKSYFQGQTLTLDFDAITIDEGANQETLPSQYADVCFEIVNESIVCETSLHLTEKVWKPILNEKPFIILGPKYAHNHLQDHFGIKPYFDLFDYEFDCLDYPERLHNMKEKNLERLLNMNINELNEIVNSDSMKEQMAYNKSQLLKYFKRIYEKSILPGVKSLTYS